MPRLPSRHAQKRKPSQQRETRSTSAAPKEQMDSQPPMRINERAQSISVRELEEDMQHVRSREKKVADECNELRKQVEQKDEELRKLKVHILQLNDYIDNVTIQHEEEKNELRRQVEAESRSYRQRNTNMSQLVSQLRQDALDEKVRYEELKTDYNRVVPDKETLLNDFVALEKKSYNLEVRAEAAENQVKELSHQKKQWSEAESAWMERVERAEALVLEMERDTAQAHKENDEVKSELQNKRVKYEDMQIQLLQSQKKEGDVRAALSEAAATAEKLIELRQENEELSYRDVEQRELIKELRAEKQKMMFHLQNGIKERQDVIDSLCLSGASANPQLQLKMMEVESLKSQLTGILQKAEEESATSQEYAAVLKQRATAAEEGVEA
eukprot:gene15189-23199_t